MGHVTAVCIWQKKKAGSQRKGNLRNGGTCSSCHRNTNLRKWASKISLILTHVASSLSRKTSHHDWASRPTNNTSKRATKLTSRLWTHPIPQRHTLYWEVVRELRRLLLFNLEGGVTTLKKKKERQLECNFDEVFAGRWKKNYKKKICRKGKENRRGGGRERKENYTFVRRGKCNQLACSLVRVFLPRRQRRSDWIRCTFLFICFCTEASML